MINIKEIVTRTTAEFAYAGDGSLWYEIVYPSEERGSIIRKTFLVGVPFEDVVGARFEKTEKAIHLMRWIRKQIESNNAK